EIEALPGEALREALALEPFHGEVRLPLGREPMGDMADDAGMIELGQDPRLMLEAGASARVGLAEELDRDLVASHAVPRPVHRPTPPAAGGARESEGGVDDPPNPLRVRPPRLRIAPIAPPQTYFWFIGSHFIQAPLICW